MVTLTTNTDLVPFLIARWLVGPATDIKTFYLVQFGGPHFVILNLASQVPCNITGSLIQFEITVQLPWLEHLWNHVNTLET